LKAVATPINGSHGAAERGDPSLSATDAARAAIRFLAERKLVPTPGNYRRAWVEVGGPSGGADAEQVAQAAVRLLTQRAEPGEAGYVGLGASVREQRWSEALATLLQLARQAPKGRWGTLLAAVIEASMGSGRDWPTPRRLDAIAAAAHDNANNDAALRASLELLLAQWRADPPHRPEHTPLHVEAEPPRPRQAAADAGDARAAAGTEQAAAAEDPGLGIARREPSSPPPGSRAACAAPRIRCPGSRRCRCSAGR
jgi:diguanylate cyclase